MVKVIIRKNSDFFRSVIKYLDEFKKFAADRDNIIRLQAEVNQRAPPKLKG